MSIANKRRNQGSEEQNSDLLINRDVAEEGNVDMAVRREKRDQREQAAQEQGDPILDVEQHNPIHAKPIIQLYQPVSGESGTGVGRVRRSRNLDSQYTLAYCGGGVGKTSFKIQWCLSSGPPAQRTGTKAWSMCH